MAEVTMKARLAWWFKYLPFKCLISRAISIEPVK